MIVISWKYQGKDYGKLAGLEQDSTMGLLTSPCFGTFGLNFPNFLI